MVASMIFVIFGICSAVANDIFINSDRYGIVIPTEWGAVTPTTSVVTFDCPSAPLPDRIKVDKCSTSGCRGSAKCCRTILGGHVCLQRPEGALRGEHVCSGQPFNNKKDDKCITRGCPRDDDGCCRTTSGGHVCKNWGTGLQNVSGADYIPVGQD